MENYSPSHPTDDIDDEILSNKILNDNSVKSANDDNVSSNELSVNNFAYENNESNDTLAVNNSENESIESTNTLAANNCTNQSTLSNNSQIVNDCDDVILKENLTRITDVGSKDLSKEFELTIQNPQEENNKSDELKSNPISNKSCHETVNECQKSLSNSKSKRLPLKLKRINDEVKNRNYRSYNKERDSRSSSMSPRGVYETNKTNLILDSNSSKNKILDQNKKAVINRSPEIQSKSTIESPKTKLSLNSAKDNSDQKHSLKTKQNKKNLSSSTNRQVSSQSKIKGFIKQLTPEIGRPDDSVKPKPSNISCLPEKRVQYGFEINRETRNKSWSPDMFLEYEDDDMDVKNKLLHSDQKICEDFNEPSMKYIRLERNENTKSFVKDLRYIDWELTHPRIDGEDINEYEKRYPQSGSIFSGKKARKIADLSLNQDNLQFVHSEFDENEEIGEHFMHFFDEDNNSDHVPIRDHRPQNNQPFQEMINPLRIPQIDRQLMWNNQRENNRLPFSRPNDIHHEERNIMEGYVGNIGRWNQPDPHFSGDNERPTIRPLMSIFNDIPDDRQWQPNRDDIRGYQIMEEPRMRPQILNKPPLMNPPFRIDEFSERSMLLLNEEEQMRRNWEFIDNRPFIPIDDDRRDHLSMSGVRVQEYDSFSESNNNSVMESRNMSWNNMAENFDVRMHWQPDIVSFPNDTDARQVHNNSNWSQDRSLEMERDDSSIINNGEQNIVVGNDIKLLADVLKTSDDRPVVTNDKKMTVMHTNNQELRSSRCTKKWSQSFEKLPENGSIETGGEFTDWLNTQRGAKDNLEIGDIEDRNEISARMNTEAELARYRNKESCLVPRPSELSVLNPGRLEESLVNDNTFQRPHYKDPHPYIKTVPLMATPILPPQETKIQSLQSQSLPISNVLYAPFSIPQLPMLNVQVTQPPSSMSSQVCQQLQSLSQHLAHQTPFIPPPPPPTPHSSPKNHPIQHPPSPIINQKQQLQSTVNINPPTISKQATINDSPMTNSQQSIISMTHNTNQSTPSKDISLTNNNQSLVTQTRPSLSSILENAKFIETLMTKAGLSNDTLRMNDHHQQDGSKSVNDTFHNILKTAATSVISRLVEKQKVPVPPADDVYDSMSMSPITPPSVSPPSPSSTTKSGHIPVSSRQSSWFVPPPLPSYGNISKKPTDTEHKLPSNSNNNSSLSAAHADKASDIDFKKRKRNEFHSKNDWQERVAMEVKLFLKPAFVSHSIDKGDYKDIMKRCVTKITRSGVTEIHTEKIAKFVTSYVEKYNKNRKASVNTVSSSEHR